MMFFMKDDQQAFVRVSLMMPHILAIDMPRLVKSNQNVRKSRLVRNISEHLLEYDYGKPLKYVINFNSILYQFIPNVYCNHIASEYAGIYKHSRDSRNLNSAGLIFAGGMMMTGYKSVLFLEGRPLLTPTLIFHRVLIRRLSNTLQLQHDLLLVVFVQGIQQQVGILHCNNKKSNCLYARKMYRLIFRKLAFLNKSHFFRCC
jgi:hypothetical protein